jgi:hypothetical protein
MSLARVSGAAGAQIDRPSGLRDRRELANQQQFFPATNIVKSEAFQTLPNAAAGIDSEPATRRVDGANVPNRFDAGTPVTAPQNYVQLGGAIRPRDEFHPAQHSTIRRKMAIETANCYLNRTAPV